MLAIVGLLALIPASVRAQPPAAARLHQGAVPPVQRPQMQSRSPAMAPAPVQDAVADSLTLEEVVRRVVETHPAVLEARQGVAVSQARIRGAESGRYPTVSATGTYSHIGPVSSLEFQGRNITLFPSNNYDAQVTVRQTVYDAGRRDTEVARARSVEESVAGNVDLVRSNLAYQTIDAFNAILFFQENLTVLDEETAALQRHLEVTRERVRAGSATEFDVLTTQVRIADVGSRRVDVTSTMESRRIELRQLLGLASDTSLVLVGGFDGEPLNLNTDSLVALALSQRQEMKVARTNEGTAQVQTELASLGDKPSLNVNLTVGAKNGYVPHLNALKPNWVAGMSVDVPLFNGYRTLSQVEESRAALDEARLRTRVLARNVRMQVEQAIASVRASQEKIGTSELQVEQAQEALRLANTRYQAGVVTNLDVLDAQTSLSEAKLTALQAQYDLVRNRYRLEQAVGDAGW